MAAVLTLSDVERARRIALLASFADAAETEAFGFGALDCMLFLASWARELVYATTGETRDAAAGLRGRYSTDAGWREIAKREGGLGVLLVRCASSVGMVELSPGDEIVAGDVALIALPRLDGAFGGIYAADGRWLAKPRDGLISYRAAMVTPAWRLPCPSS